MKNTNYVAGNPCLTSVGGSIYYTTTTTTASPSYCYPSTSGGTNWDTYTYVVPNSNNYNFEVDCSIRLGGKNINKIDWDLSRFTLIKRLKFLYDLIFKGKAIMEVDPKLIKLEKALDVLKNAK